MGGVPHPDVAPSEPQDWRPLLDRELNLLPEKYRAPIVLCDLEGRPRREAARLLGATEGTLSSRLARGRALLAKRLTRCGVALSGGALTVALSEGAASAQVPAALVWSTAKAAAHVAAGRMMAGSTPAVLLMKGVMKAMLLKKLRLVVGAVVVLAALGAVGFGYQAGSGPGAVQAAQPDKPRSEVEALRRENELLKLNLEVVLEKVRAQEAELRTLRGQAADAAKLPPHALHLEYQRYLALKMLGEAVHSDPLGEAESALKALREAKDKEGQRRATEALEKALEKLKQQTKPGADPGKPPGH